MSGANVAARGQQSANHNDMSTRRSVKSAIHGPHIVAVIASAGDLQRALRLRRLPDFFELRLDALHKIADEVFVAAQRLRTPCIVTARHPAEGGLHRVSAARRRALLIRFLPIAAIVDVELRSVLQMQHVLQTARETNVRCLISVHDLKSTLPLAELTRLAKSAKRQGADIFKLATCTKDSAHQARLVSFWFHTKPLLPISVMSIGKDARVLRLFFARQGSVLNYAHLGKAQVAGQLSLADLRRAVSTRAGAK